MSSDILSQNRNDVQKLAELSNVLRLVGGSLITALTASNIGADIASAKNVSTSKCSCCSSLCSSLCSLMRLQIWCFGKKFPTHLNEHLVNCLLPVVEMMNERAGVPLDHWLDKTTASHLWSSFVSLGKHNLELNRYLSTCGAANNK